MVHRIAWVVAAAVGLVLTVGTCSALHGEVVEEYEADTDDLEYAV